MKRAAFNIYVALNMLLCAVVFFGCGKPRETISGLTGRKVGAYRVEALEHLASVPDSRYPPFWCFVFWLLWTALEVAVNLLYWWEPYHCQMVARDEKRARYELYGEPL